MCSSFVSRILDPIRNLFDFNQAHLSGCMDVIVIRQKNGSLVCSPFHVRFGTFKIMKVKDIVINMEINGEMTPFTMNIGEDGHGFFLKEVDDTITNKILLKPTLRLHSDKLKKMGLLYGENKIIYSVQSELQGKQTLQGRIFFWDEKGLQIVISDIDGTVTRSDLMGHVMTVLKKDWTHKGIARLFSRFENKGHKMVYITARPATQYLYTLRYMERVDQEGFKLPTGPILMSPDLLFDSMKREGLKDSDKLKIPIIKDLRKLLICSESPFLAGFGNRESDAVAYLANGLPKSRIFIINKKSQIQKLDSPNILTYDILEEDYSEYFE